MSAKLDELKLDLDELGVLLQQATRQRSKDLLTLEIRRLQTELAHSVGSAKDDIPFEQNDNTRSTPGTAGRQKCYEVKLNNYCWDQTNRTAKIYVTLKNVQHLPKESVICNFTEQSLHLLVLGLENRNYHLSINNLSEAIVPEKSYVRVKTDMVVVCVAKKQEKNWSHITGVEKKIKESRASGVSDDTDDSDPGANLINLIKKMYQDGDDDLKRTIAKVWTENREKMAGEIPEFS